MYDLIAANKRNSFLLAFLMALLLIATGGAIGVLAVDDPLIGVVMAAAVTAVLLPTSYFGGRSIIMGISGAKKIEHADHPQLFNVVEEMAIAAGLPVPDVYIIDDSAPNAFATGRDPKHAALAITTGLLDKLDRDELQGVMAHEMSHIRNYDIRFAMLMAVMVGVIALMTDHFRRITFYGHSPGRSRRSSNDRDGGGAAQLVIFLMALLLAILAPLFAKIIQMAISRQREFLADASAAELTRYPEGLARALEKIASDREPLEAANRATQHLYIINPLRVLGGQNLFSSHPDTAERISRLRSIGANEVE